MLMERTGRTISDLQSLIDSTLQPHSVSLKDAEVAVSLSARETRARSDNIIGICEGSDPALKDEYVLYIAHYDHDGMRNGLIYNGADDNASGAGALLELAAAFAKSDPLRRSVAFIHFTAEEQGLLGSKYFVAHPVIPLKRIVAVINLDMIGRNHPDSLL